MVVPTAEVEVGTVTAPMIDTMIAAVPVMVVVMPAAVHVEKRRGKRLTVIRRVGSG